MERKQARRRFLKSFLAGSSVAAGATYAAAKSHSEESSNTGGRSTHRKHDCLSKPSDPKSALIEYMQTLPVIDGHTHLRPEAWRLRYPITALTFFSTHPALDANSSVGPSGNFDPPFKQAYTYLNDPKIPLLQRWREFQPYLENARFGSFYRASEIALRDIYGVERLSEYNIEEVSKRIQAENKPGIYRKILRDRCNIETCLVQCSGAQFDELAPRPLLSRIYSGPTTYKHNIAPFVRKIEEQYGLKISDLDAYLDTLGRFLKDKKNTDGAVGLKIYAWGEWMYVEPDRGKANKDFKETLAKGVSVSPVLEATIKDHELKLCAEWDWPVSVHGGGNYMDFRLYEPRKIIDMITRHSQTKFDIFHLGIPKHHEIIFIAKHFPNVTLNLVWAEAVSESLTRQAINEIIDAVPINKVTAFGSDVREHVEIAYGYLVMMREIMAEALSERIRRGRLNLEDAQLIARRWFYDNPTEVYKLKV